VLLLREDCTDLRATFTAADGQVESEALANLSNLFPIFNGLELAEI
jgi:hypothetical protein